VAYSTVSMVRLALVPSSTGSLPSQPTNTAADLSDAQISDAIAEADSLIDGYLGKFYTVPVASPTPHPVDYFSRNIAAYNATLSYRGSQDFSDDDPVARRYRATMDALKQISNGAVFLGQLIAKNTGDTAPTGAAPAYNPYQGDLWTPDDFDLTPMWDGWSNARP
jgi:phage gp36-like protein